MIEDISLPIITGDSTIDTILMAVIISIMITVIYIITLYCLTWRKMRDQFERIEEDGFEIKK